MKSITHDKNVFFIYTGPKGFSSGKEICHPDKEPDTNALWFSLHCVGRHKAKKDTLSNFLNERIKDMGNYLFEALNVFYPGCLAEEDLKYLCECTEKVQETRVRNLSSVKFGEKSAHKKETELERIVRRSASFLFVDAQINERHFYCEVSVNVQALDKDCRSIRMGNKGSVYEHYKEFSLACIEDIFLKYGLPSPISSQKTFTHADVRIDAGLVLAQTGETSRTTLITRIKNAFLGIQGVGVFRGTKPPKTDIFRLMPENVAPHFGVSYPNLVYGVWPTEKQKARLTLKMLDERA